VSGAKSSFSFSKTDEYESGNVGLW